MADYIKYITYNDGLMDTVIIFPNHEMHNYVAFRMSITADMILGAGFLTPDFEAYGKSVGLSVPSRGEVDTKLIRSVLHLDKKE